MNPEPVVILSVFSHRQLSQQKYDIQLINHLGFEINIKIVE